MIEYKVMGLNSTNSTNSTNHAEHYWRPARISLSSQAPSKNMLNIVLVNPEIPHNTGAAGRLALATDSTLHLIEPLGFDISDKAVKRSGLDYWKDVKLKKWSSWEAFENSLTEDDRLFMLTTKSKKPHWDAQFQKNDYLVFGRETKGLDEALIAQHSDLAFRIPMIEGSTRSLNLATSVGIVLYEAFRQINTNQ